MFDSCNNHVSLMYQIEGADKNSIGTRKIYSNVAKGIKKTNLLSLFKVFFQSVTESFGIFDEFTFPLIQRLFSGASRNKSVYFVHGIQKFFNGTSYLPEIKNFFLYFQVFKEMLLLYSL